MDSSAQAGYVDSDGNIRADGSTYSGSPVVGNSSLIRNSSALLLRMPSGGLVVMATGGHYAPEANELGS